MNRLRVLLVIAVCLVVFTALQMHNLSRSPTWDPVCDHASFRTNEWGTKALRELLGKSGLATKTWGAPWTQLSDQVQQLWIINPQRPPTERDTEALLKWVAAGGMAVVLPDPRPEQRGLSVLDREDANETLLWRLGRQAIEAGAPERLVPTRGGDPLLRDVNRLLVPAGARLQPADPEAPPAPEDHTPPGEPPRPMLAPGAGRIIVQDDGGVIALRIAHGRGSIVLLCDADMVSNSRIATADNVILAANVAFAAGGAPVWFDEYHHGVRERVSEALDATAPTRAIWAALAALALFFAGKLQRFGRPVPADPPPRRAALEHVRAFASLYRRAGHGQAALGKTVARFRRRLATVAMVPADAPDERLAGAVARRRPQVNERRLAALLGRCRAALERRPPVPDVELLDLTRAICDMEQELGSHDN